MAEIERPAAAPSDVWSLLLHGRDAGLNTIGSALELDLEYAVDAESERAKNHLDTLSKEFIQAEVKQRMLQALVKGKDELDGEGSSLLGVLSDISSSSNNSHSMENEMRAQDKHQNIMKRLKEQQKQSESALAEVQSHTTELASAIKEDIKKLLQGQSTRWLLRIYFCPVILLCSPSLTALCVFRSCVCVCVF